MGRPRSYDREEVLRRAVRMFRFRSFHAVSVREIVETTSLNRFAIYEKFGGKSELFYACLDFYLESAVKRDLLGPLAGDQGTFDGLMALLARLRANNLNPDMPAGCLIVNASIEFGGADERVERIHDAFRAALRQAFLPALRDADARAEQQDARSVERRADYLVAMINAFMVLRHVSRAAAEEHIVAVIDEVTTWSRKRGVNGVMTRPDSIGAA